jgi:hypothetical protein
VSSGLLGAAAVAAIAAYLGLPKTPSAPMLEPTHYLALWMPTGELMACVPINQDIHFLPDTIRRMHDNPGDYDDGALALYVVALTDDPDDEPPGFDAIYAGGGLPDGHAAAWAPA